MIFRSIFLSVLLLCPSLTPAAPWSPTQFTLSYWDGPPPQETTLPRYQQIKDAHFTLIFPPHGTMSPEQNKTLLDLCQQLQLKAVLADARIPTSLDSPDAKTNLDAVIKDYADHPALAAYFIKDEPSANDFPGLAAVVAYLKEHDPAHPAYINLFPTYATPGQQLGTPTYDEYLEQFLSQVKPFALSYDHYHFTNHGDRPGFFENLAAVRNAAIKHDLPFWNIVLTLRHYDYRLLTEPELRFESMQSLAFGAKGLLWYTYWYPGPLTPAVSGAMIHHDGSKDPHYDMISRINADTLAIGNQLVPTTCWATWQTGDGAIFSPPTNSPITASPGPLTLGLFTFPDDPAARVSSVAPKRFLLLLTNRDYKNPITTTLTPNPTEQFDPAINSWSPHTTPTITLPPAGALLLRIR